MAFPKEGTHALTVNSITYLWHLHRHHPNDSRWIVIRQQDQDGQLLMVDPLGSALRSNAGIAHQAIAFALAHGWTPDQHTHPLKVGYTNEPGNTGAFTVLPGDTEL